MLNRWIIGVFVSVSLLSLTSCFKDEPLNAEADIEAAYLSSAAKDMFFNEEDTFVSVPYNTSDVVFHVRQSADVSALAPQFRITEGAAISPASGTVGNFNEPVKYTVTSQDGQWKRVYNVSFKKETRQVSDVVAFDFENYRLDETGKYYEWYETFDNGEAYNYWATGNPGFAIPMGSAKKEDYPSTVLEDGYEGKGVKLTTLSTGAFGAILDRRIAAGNLFAGEFDLPNAIVETLKATRFGRLFVSKPLKFTGYYKYRQGDTYQDEKGNPVAGKKDMGTIYAILYRNTDNQGQPVVLFGDNIQTSSQIVAKAIVEDFHPTEDWTAFSVDFKYLKDFDFNILTSNGYNLAVVCSSSQDGAYFRGAVGSTLCVDKLRIECQKIEE